MKFLANLMITLCLFFGFSIQDSCLPNQYQAKNAFSKSDQLIHSLNQFEKDRVLSSIGLSNAYQNLDSILQTYRIENARQTSLAFEQIWIDDVIDRITALNSKFQRVVKHSNAYFSLLYQLTDEIEDEVSRQAEINKNEELTEAWREKLTTANTKLKEIDKVLKKGNDLYKILMISVLRDSLAIEIEEIIDITFEANEILQGLKNLADDGATLLKSAPGRGSLVSTGN